jgi:hypothetical protein
VPAGNYGLVLDCFIGGNVTVTYSVLWEHAGSDVTVLTFQQAYVKPPNDNIPVISRFTEPGIAIDYSPGDQLILQWSTDAQSSPSAYTPNGDGSAAPEGSGSDVVPENPNITLPM